MKTVLVTQRVEFLAERNERRDCLDQRWIDLLLKCGLRPWLLPNHLAYCQELLNSADFDGILLTGGNSPVIYGGDAPERDQLEVLLIEYALQHNVPLLGVCRGMQMLQQYFGVSLQEVSNHVANRHLLRITEQSRLDRNLSQLRDVNAYHRFGSFASNAPLNIAAYAEDNVVMAVEHVESPIFGQMWHSERETPFRQEELQVIKTVFGGQW